MTPSLTVAGALNRIKTDNCCTSRTDNLAVNQQGQRQISVSQMTDGKDETWSTDGATENAGVENAIRAKLQGWKMQEWKKQE